MTGADIYRSQVWGVGQYNTVVIRIKQGCALGVGEPEVRPFDSIILVCLFK